MNVVLKIIYRVLVIHKNTGELRATMYLKIRADMAAKGKAGGLEKNPKAYREKCSETSHESTEDIHPKMNL